MSHFVKLTKRFVEEAVLLNADWIVEVQPKKSKRFGEFSRVTYMPTSMGSSKVDVQESFDQIEEMLKKVVNV